MAVDVWAVPYRTQTGATPPQYNNGPITFALDKAEQTGGGWTGSVNLDSDKISAVSHGYGYFLFCHGTYRGDPPIDDPTVANPISQRARVEGRFLDRR